MADLFALCVKEDAAILAHANDSNGANEDFGRRADPGYWIDVFRKHPTLRVCLAHFGHFDTTSHDAPAGAKPPDASWEWALGRPNWKNHHLRLLGRHYHLPHPQPHETG